MLFVVYAAVGRVTVISLQPGEELVTVVAGDTVHWIVGDTSSGSGADRRVNVLVKPIRSSLKTNLVITTSRRTYLLELTSTAKAWMASVSWENIQRTRCWRLQRQAQAASAAAPVDSLHITYTSNSERGPARALGSIRQWCDKIRFEHDQISPIRADVF